MIPQETYLRLPKRLMNKISNLTNRFFEWSFQRNANKQFDKSKLHYRDGDNT